MDDDALFRATHFKTVVARATLLLDIDIDASPKLKKTQMDLTMCHVVACKRLPQNPPSKKMAMAACGRKALPFLLSVTCFLCFMVRDVTALPSALSSSIGHSNIAPKRKLQLSAAKKSEYTPRLTLRGGGLPVIPIVAVAAAAIALKVNEGLRNLVMEVLSHVSIGGDARRRPQKKQARKANVVKKEEKVTRTPLKPGYDLRNG